MIGNIQEEAVQVSFKAAEITVSGLRAVIQALVSNRDSIVHGEQSLKKLNMQGKQLESVPITGEDLKNLRRELNRYSVDFHIQKGPDDGNFTAYFKSQDVDRIYKGLENCVKDFDKNKAKRPIKETMEQATQKSKELAANKPAPDKKMERRQEL